MTINALRKRGLTGEELRCLMWGRESINSPVKVKKYVFLFTCKLQCNQFKIHF